METIKILVLESHPSRGCSDGQDVHTSLKAGRISWGVGVL